jgi:hypothetical protein
MSTKTKILKAGIKLWKKNPDLVTALGISKAVNPPMVHATILYHFPKDSIKDAVAAYAVETGESGIIAQLILIEHPAVKNLSVEERQRHFAAATAV